MCECVCVCVCVCVPINLYEEIYYKVLAHAIMGAEKSQDLQLSNWKPRRADGVVVVWVIRPENQKTQRSENQQAPHPGRADVSVRVWSQEKTNVPAQGIRSGRIFPSLSLFVLSWPSTDWMRPIHRKGNLLDSKSTTINVNSHLIEHLHRNIQNNYWLNIWAPWPSQDNIKLTIILPYTVVIIWGSDCKGLWMPD